MTDVKEPPEERVRERAYALWERDGKPDGRAHEYWEQARRELDVSDEPGAEPPAASEQKR
jgi:hypothetical protein